VSPTDSRPIESESAAFAFLWGALTAVVGTFPLAALCALVFRFPVPFGVT
jgi:hypothetical protein